MKEEDEWKKSVFARLKGGEKLLLKAWGGLGIYRHVLLLHVWVFTDM